jgi:hypothetical protein
MKRPWQFSSAKPVSSYDTKGVVNENKTMTARSSESLSGAMVPFPAHFSHGRSERRRFEGPREDGQTQEKVDENLRHYAAVLETLLDASTRQGKLWALRPAYQNAINKLIKDFDLEKDFRRLLNVRLGVKDPWSKGSLYTIVNGALYEERRKQAKDKRQEFYELQQFKLRAFGAFVIMASSTMK